MKLACAMASSLATHLTRPFRIIATVSIPCKVRHAVANEPYPFASQVRFFTVRWSCSTTLARGRILRFQPFHCRWKVALVQVDDSRRGLPGIQSLTGSVWQRRVALRREQKLDVWPVGAVQIFVFTLDLKVSSVR